MTSTSQDSEPKFKLNGERAKQEAYGFKSKFPYFVKKVQASCLNPGQVTTPKDFARKHFQKGKKMLLQNEKGESWSVNFISTRPGIICGGWKEFSHKNHLKLGDYLVFELVKGGLMQVHIYRCSSMSSDVEHGLDTKTGQSLKRGGRSRALQDLPRNMTSKSEDSEPKFKLNGERAKQEAYGFESKFPYFVKKVQASCLNPGQVTTPKDFARKHFHKGKKMLLQNEKGESWSVNFISKRLGLICGGWKEFSHENHLKLGDYLVFELVKGGLMQVHIYRCSSMSSDVEQVLDTKTGQSLKRGGRSRALEDLPRKKSQRCIDEADMNFDHGCGEDSGFSENYVSHGASSSLLRRVASTSSSSSSSEGSCFIVECSRRSSVPDSPLGGPKASLMAGSPARVKTECNKMREGSNGGHFRPATCAASLQRTETSSVRGAVPVPGVGVQGVDIGYQMPEVVGASVSGGIRWCDTGVTMVGAKDEEDVATGAAIAMSGRKIGGATPLASTGEDKLSPALEPSLIVEGVCVSPAGLEPGLESSAGPKASPRMVMSYDMEMVEGFPVRACYAGLYKRICSRHGHLASSAVIKLMPTLVVAAVTETLRVILEIEACAENELLLSRISDWETCLGTVEALGLRVGWVQSRLKELSGIVTRMDLVKEARVAVPRLTENVESAKAAYEAAKVKLVKAESAMAANAQVLNQVDDVAITSRSVLHGLL